MKRIRKYLLLGIIGLGFLFLSFALSSKLTKMTDSSLINDEVVVDYGTGESDEDLLENSFYA